MTQAQETLCLSLASIFYLPRIGAVPIGTNPGREFQKGCSETETKQLTQEESCQRTMDIASPRGQTQTWIRGLGYVLGITPDCHYNALKTGSQPHAQNVIKQAVS